MEEGRIFYLCLSWSCDIVLFCPWNVTFSIPGSQAFRFRLYYSINSALSESREYDFSVSIIIWANSQKKFLYMNIYPSISFCCWEPWRTDPLLFVCWLKRRYDLTASLNRTISSLLSPHSSILLLPWREGAERNCSRGIILSSLSWEVKFFRVRVIVI